MDDQMLERRLKTLNQEYVLLKARLSSHPDDQDMKRRYEELEVHINAILDRLASRRADREAED